MALFTDITDRTAALRRVLGDAISVEQLPSVFEGLDDEAVCELLRLASEAGQLIEQIALVASGAVVARSLRSAGHSGLAQSLGHRTPAALVQRVTGATRAEALHQLRVGEALISRETGDELRVDQFTGDELTGGEVVSGEFINVGVVSGELTNDEPSENEEPLDFQTRSALSWRTVLRNHLAAGNLSVAQYDAIARGLGDPPRDADGTLTFEVHAAWSSAAERLSVEAAHVSVEELAKSARAIRDLLDPSGAEARFQQRYESRSFRMWIDSDEQHHGRFVFDDQTALWVHTIIDSALRPRRGGPRFVSAEEQSAAKTLLDDPRTNDQLAHDLITDLMKSGALADVEAVFGARQAGVRIVQVVDREKYLAAKREAKKPGLVRVSATIRAIDGNYMLPQAAAEQLTCETGRQQIVVDEFSNPLDIGREQRLYASQQRIALAIRDGGCRWNACDRPASFCEAHHIDHWGADEGRTDIDRGILLCRFHHMQLHTNGWKITRDHLGPFMLHPPPDERLRKQSAKIGAGVGADAAASVGADASSQEQLESRAGPIELRPRAAVDYALKLAAPPSKLFRGAAYLRCPGTLSPSCAAFTARQLLPCSMTTGDRMSTRDQCITK